MSEFDRIARLTRRFAMLEADRALRARGGLGVVAGDDAAVLPTSDARDGALVLSVDAAVEGVHFDLRWLDVAAAAARATEAALSDLAAMGAEVRDGAYGGTGILCAWTVPRTADEAVTDALAEGVARAAERAGCAVLGGNLSAGPVLSLTTTVIGRIPPGFSPVERRGARAGDGLYVSGPVGRAALGLRALMRGTVEHEALREAVDAWRHPRARLDQSAWVREHASACVDLSDGLVQDAGHVAQASHVACHFAADAIREAISERTLRAAELLGVDALACALSGGEDYELLVASSVPPPDGWLRVGDVREGSGVWLTDGDAPRRVDESPPGWDHFRAPR